MHQVVNSLQKRRIVIAREAEGERGNLAPVTICSSQRERGQQQSPSVELFLETENIQSHTIIFNNIQLYTN